jgi:hypothetical protein
MSFSSTPGTGSTALSRSAISSDISTLLSLPGNVSHNLLGTTDPSVAHTQDTSTLQSLSAFSPSARPDDGSAVDAAVALSAAYTRDMRSLQRQGLEAELEQAGQGIEKVREQAEGVQVALSEVKL